MKTTKKLAVSGLIIAIYVVVMFYTQTFAFGEYQIRIATSMYALTYIWPFLILPLGLANLISNTLMGGLGPFDMFGGMAVGIVASTLVYLIKRFKLNSWLVIVPIIFIPGLCVPIWLSYLINVPYKVLAISLCIGQVVPALVGALLVDRMKRIIR